MAGPYPVSGMVMHPVNCGMPMPMMPMPMQPMQPGYYMCVMVPAGPIPHIAQPVSQSSQVRVQEVMDKEESSVEYFDLEDAEDVGSEIPADDMPTIDLLGPDLPKTSKRGHNKMPRADVDSASMMSEAETGISEDVESAVLDLPDAPPGLTLEAEPYRTPSELRDAETDISEDVESAVLDLSDAPPGLTLEAEPYRTPSELLAMQAMQLSEADMKPSAAESTPEEEKDVASTLPTTPPLSWSVEEVLRWMVGMEPTLVRCEPQLEENLIDGRALSLLSQEDLIDLGVPQHLCEVIFEEIQKLFEESAVQV